MILIVDDHPENIFSLKTILELHSFPVDTASSGEEALKKILKRSYALIILDVQMPGMDGFEVAEILSGYNSAKDIPVIFVSAVNTDKSFIAKGYSSGGIDYIVKPIDPDILLLKVKTFYKLYEQNRTLNEMQENLKKEVAFRKNAQAETHEKVKELHSILESIPQIAFTANEQGKIEFVNRHWYSYSTSGTSFPSSFPGDPNISSVWERAIVHEESIELEVRIRKIGEERYRYHLLRTIPITKKGSIVKWVGTFTDIDEQKKVIEKKDEFISIASHELKTPLASIKAYVQLLDRITEKQDKSKTYVERTLIQVNKLDNLISDLLDISKIESGKLQLNNAYFDFGTMLINAIDIIQQTYPDHRVIRTAHAAVPVFGDEMRIEQVVLNYLNNAIKYSPGSKEIHVDSHVKNGDHMVLCVKDFGIGIPKEKQSYVFSKFYRAEDSSNHFQGLGIGLYICAEIIQRHGGSFWVESQPGEGSSFFFSIPLQQQSTV